MTLNPLNYRKVIYFANLQWVSAREKFQQAANLMDAEQRMKKSMWGQFWSAHQRFFKYLCIASKVRRVVQLAREDVKNGKVRLTFSYNNKAFREKDLKWFWLCWSLTFSVVCGDWSSVNWRGSNPWGLGGGRRRAQWLCLHCKVSVIHLQEVVLVFCPNMKIFSPLRPSKIYISLFIWTDLEKCTIGEQVM